MYIYIYIDQYIPTTDACVPTIVRCFPNMSHPPCRLLSAVIQACFPWVYMLYGQQAQRRSRWVESH